jgi:hypothetical protein
MEKIYLYGEKTICLGGNRRPGKLRRRDNLLVRTDWSRLGRLVMPSQAKKKKKRCM